MRDEGQMLKRNEKGKGAAIFGRARNSRYCEKLKGRQKTVQARWDVACVGSSLPTTGKLSSNSGQNVHLFVPHEVIPFLLEHN